MMHIKYDQNQKMQMLTYDEHTFWLTNIPEKYDCISLFGSELNKVAIFLKSEGSCLSFLTEYNSKKTKQKKTECAVQSVQFNSIFKTTLNRKLSCLNIFHLLFIFLQTLNHF